MWDDDADSWCSEMAYLPPWRERLPDGSLGPSYGPPSLSAYEKSLTEFQVTTAAGGLWDPVEAALSRPTRGRAEQRHDTDVIEQWLRVSSHRLPRRELEVAVMYWRDKQSIGRVARRLCLAPNTVAGYVGRLRRRLGTSRCTMLQALGYDPHTNRP